MERLTYLTVKSANLNRQIIATKSSIGKYKVDVMQDRRSWISIGMRSPCNNNVFDLPETKDQFDFSQYDYVVDAVDTVTAKLQIVEEAEAAGVPVISSMGSRKQARILRLFRWRIFIKHPCVLL